MFSVLTLLTWPLMLKNLNRINFFAQSIFIFLICCIHNCYASNIFHRLTDREIEPWEALILIGSVLTIFITPQKYRTKFAGVIFALIVIYFMIIVFNISQNIEIIGNNS